MAEGKRTPHLPPDDSFEPEMTAEEAFERVMRIKLETNRALRASEKSAQQSDKSETTPDRDK